MSGLWDRYKTDGVCETEGVWVPYQGGVELLLARAGGSNLKYKRAVEKFARQKKREIDQGTLTEEDTLPIFRKVYARTVVLGWRTCTGKTETGELLYEPTVENIDGHPMAFNERNCIKLFEDLPDFFASVQSDAQDIQNYLAANLEDDAKNSSPSSSTTPD